MNQLVIIQNRQAVTTSLQVAEDFKKQHKDVLESIRNLIAENSATKNMFREDTYESRGKKYPMYYMNRDGFTLLAMGFNGKKALNFKLKYIQAFNQMEQRLLELNQPSYMILDPEKRAEKWIEEHKEKRLLHTKNLALEQHVNEMKPKASYYDLILQNKSLLTVNKIAKDYGMSATTFNRKLHELGIQYRQGETWLVYAKYQNKGYTHTEPYVINQYKSKIITKWTQKGRRFLYDVLKENGILPMIERDSKVV